MQNNNGDIPTDKEWYTKTQVMSLLQVSASTLYQYYKRGKVKKVPDPHRIFREVRYYKDEVDELARAKDGEPTGLKPSEAATELGLSVQQVYKYIRDGHLEVRTIPFGDERLSYLIDKTEIIAFKNKMNKIKSNKGRKKVFYNNRLDIALYQKFISNHGKARVIRGTDNSWQFHILNSDEVINYEQGLTKYNFKPAYNIHQKEMKIRGYSLISIPKNDSNLFPVIDYLYEVWGIENLKVEEKADLVNLYVQAGIMPLNTAEFTLREILPYVKKGTWTAVGANLLIESGFKKTSIELPIDLLNRVKREAEDRNITMSQHIENLIRSSLEKLN